MSGSDWRPKGGRLCGSDPEMCGVTMDAPHRVWNARRGVVAACGLLVGRHPVDAEVLVPQA